MRVILRGRKAITDALNERSKQKFTPRQIDYLIRNGRLAGVEKIGPKTIIGYADQLRLRPSQPR
jgi:hypothetical protein